MATKLEGTRKVLENLNKYREIVFDEAVDIFEGNFRSATEQARARAPWTDRTGDARTSIDNNVVVKRNQNIIGIMGIGVEYGVFLELANAGKYKIIRPTLRVLQEILLDQFKGVKIKDLAK